MICCFWLLNILSKKKLMQRLMRNINDEKTSLTYFGVFNDRITAMLIDLAEEFVSKQKGLNKLSKRTSFLIAESFQNVVRHGLVEKSKESGLISAKDFYQISVLTDRIVISSANLIKKSDARELEQFIDNVNALSADELKTLKRKLLKTSEMSAKGGAGLGIIEMVRKSGLPLKQNFIPLSDNFSLVVLSLEAITDKHVKEHKISIQQIEETYKTLADENIILLYSGDFSSSSNSSIIEMLNTNFLKGDEIDPARLRNIVAIIEVMQNVSKHGKKIEGYKKGIFALSIRDDDYYIECSNYIGRQDHKKLRAILGKIKLSDMAEIEKMYKEKLANSYLSGEQEGGLGMLEIARFSNNEFTYNFTDSLENETVFTIKFKTM
jgi:anti-sigma regulatory factor (Ser/Thr protein kinase)